MQHSLPRSVGRSFFVALQEQCGTGCLECDTSGAHCVRCLSPSVLELDYTVRFVPHAACRMPHAAHGSHREVATADCAQVLAACRLG